MANWKQRAERAEKQLDVIREIISYNDRDEDEKLREIEELLKDD